MNNFRKAIMKTNVNKIRFAVRFPSLTEWERSRSEWDKFRKEYIKNERKRNRRKYKTNSSRILQLRSVEEVKTRSIE